MGHDYDEHDIDQGLGEGVEDGDLDTSRAMHYQKRSGGRMAAIKKNLMHPITSVQRAFNYSRKHPFRASAIFGAHAVAGGAMARLGAGVMGQDVNTQNIVSTALTTYPTMAITGGLASAVLYTGARQLDTLAGEDYLITHKKVSLSSNVVALTLVGGLSFFGNTAGDDIVDTYLMPLKNPAQAVAVIPNALVDTFTPFENTVVDPWWEPADHAFCLARHQINADAPLACRDEYWGGVFSDGDGLSADDITVSVDTSGMPNTVEGIEGQRDEDALDFITDRLPSMNSLMGGPN